MQPCFDCEAGVPSYKERAGSTRDAKYLKILLVGLAGIAFVAVGVLNKERVDAAGRRLLTNTPSMMMPVHARAAASTIPADMKHDQTFQRIIENMNKLRSVLKEAAASGSQHILSDLEANIEHIHNKSRAMSMDLLKVQSELKQLSVSKARAVSEAIEAIAAAKAENYKLKWQLALFSCFMFTALVVAFRKRFYILMCANCSVHRTAEGADIEIKGDFSTMSSISMQPLPPFRASAPTMSISGVEPSLETRISPKLTFKTVLAAQVEEPDDSNCEDQCQGTNHVNDIQEPEPESPFPIASVGGSRHVFDVADASVRSKRLMYHPMAVRCRRHSPVAMYAGSRAAVRTPSMRDHSKCEKRYRAVAKLLQIESAHLWRKLQLLASGDTLDDFQVELEMRAPLIQWSMTHLFKRAIGIHQPVFEERQLDPWQLMLREYLNANTPTLRSAIKTLKPQLKKEIVFGLRTSPLQVLRLLWLICLSHLPGPQHGMIRHSWPDALENLTETMERNLKRLLRAQSFQPSRKHRHSVRKVQIKQSGYHRFWP